MIFFKTRRNKAYKENEAAVMNLGQFLGVDLEQYDKSRLSEVTYFACLKILSEAVAKLPLSLQYVSDDGGVIDAVKSPLYSTVKIRPNPYMTPSSFWTAIENNRNHFGNAYAKIERTEKGVNLWLLDPRNVIIYWDNQQKLSETKDIFYFYSYPETGEQAIFPSEEILHFKTSTTFGGLVGIAVKDKLSLSLDGAKESQAMLNDMYKNNMTAKAVVQYTGSAEVNRSLSDKFVETLEDYAHGRKTKTFIPIPYGTSVTPLNLKLSDSQFLELRKYTALQIASAFGIKPNQLNDYEKASYSSSEAQQLAFYADTMLYILKQYEEELNYKLLTAAQIQSGYRFKFNIAAVLRGDTKAQVDSLTQGIEDVLQLARAAMCDLSRNYKAVNRRDFENVRPTLSELGKKILPQDLPLLKLEIINAILGAMPDKQENTETVTTVTDEGHLRAMCCDIIGLPEGWFWSSTHKEIAERIDYYLEAKGVKDIPTLVQMYDD